MVKIERDLPRGVKGQFQLDGYLKDNLDFYHDAVHNHNTSAVFIFDGKSGYGKTTLANQLGIYLDPKFTLNNLNFTPDSFLEALKNPYKGMWIQFDEAMLLSNRSALSQLNRMIVIAMSMIRSKNIFVAFCVNSLFDLDRNLAISRADMLFHVYGDNIKDRGKYCAFFRSPADGRDRLKELYIQGKKFYDYSKPNANFISTFSNEFVLNNDEYELKKQKGITEFLMGGEKTSGRRKDEVIKRAITELAKKGYNQVELAQVVGLSHQRISQILGEASITASSSI